MDKNASLFIKKIEEYKKESPNQKSIHILMEFLSDSRRDLNESPNLLFNINNFILLR